MHALALFAALFPVAVNGPASVLLLAERPFFAQSHACVPAYAVPPSHPKPKLSILYDLKWGYDLPVLVCAQQQAAPLV